MRATDFLFLHICRIGAFYFWKVHGAPEVCVTALRVCGNHISNLDTVRVEP